MKLVTGTSGLRPSDLTPGANDTPGDGRAAVHKQPHRESGGVPAAGGQTGKQRLCGRILAKMKRLWVELLRKLFDLAGIDAVRRAGEDLANMQVVKKQVISAVAIHSSTFRLSGRFQATTWVRQGGDLNPIDIFIIVAFGIDET